MRLQEDQEQKRIRECVQQFLYLKNRSHRLWVSDITVTQDKIIANKLDNMAIGIKMEDVILVESIWCKLNYNWIFKNLTVVIKIFFFKKSENVEKWNWKRSKHIKIKTNYI